MDNASIASPVKFSRWQAAGLHLLISACVAAIALFVMLRIWYPPPLFTAEGGTDLLFLLIAVDVVIGPLITLIVFKAGKPSLRFDLSIIALLQVGALVYGCHVMFVARPVYVALVGDQFETVRANDLDPADIAKARVADFRSLPLAGPVYVAIDIPKDMSVLKHLIAEAQKGGKIVPHLPEYYVPYARQKAQAALQSQPLEPALKDGDDFAILAQAYLRQSGRKASELKFMPLQTRRGYGTVLIDAQSGDIVTLLPPKP